MCVRQNGQHAFQWRGSGAAPLSIVRPLPIPAVFIYIMRHHTRYNDAHEALTPADDHCPSVTLPQLCQRPTKVDHNPLITRLHASSYKGSSYNCKYVIRYSDMIRIPLSHHVIRIANLATVDYNCSWPRVGHETVGQRRIYAGHPELIWSYIHVRREGKGVMCAR